MSDKKTVDVSLVVANFNNGRYLDDFVRSIRDSTVSPREIIFVDDGSTDDSLAIMKRLSGALRNLKIVPLEKNVGFGNALNAGIARSEGKYIMRIDPDDMLEPTRLQRQYEFICMKELDVVGSNAELFHGETGKTLGVTNFPLGHDTIAKVIRKGEHGVLHSTVMARAALFRNIPYVQEHVPAEDYDIFARFLVFGARFGNLPDVLIRCRVHQNSASNQLPFSTIAKTYRLRDEIFGTRTPKLKVALYYGFIKSYRKYLFSRSVVSKWTWAALCVAFYPTKLLRRLTSRSVRVDA